MTNSQPQRLRVLLVEDEPGDAHLVLLALKESRSPSFVVIHEAMLADAIDRIRMSAPFDVVVLDLNLPDSFGMETLSRVRAAGPSLPIIILTGFNDPSLAEKALDAGAQDYLVKGEISERTVARAIRYAIFRKNADQERKDIADRLAFSLAAECERMDADLAAARNMQFGLLPSRKRLDGYQQTYGLAIDGYFEPSFDVGGDLWGCAEGDDGRAVFFTLDFSGHGIGAALNVFRLHALLSEMDRRIVDPAETLGRLNRTLCDILPRGQYATIFLGVIDTDSETLTWAAGGAPRPILFDEDGVFHWLDTRGKPLGLTASADYINRTTPFRRQCCLFLYSDVMTESLVNGQDMLGEDGLAGIVSAFHSVSGIDMPGLVGRFTDIVGSPMDDDMTAVCITNIAGPRKARTEMPAAAPVAARSSLILCSPQLEAIAEGLASPHNGFLEISPAGLADVGAACFEVVEQGGICLSLTAAGARSCGVATLVMTAIRNRFDGARDWTVIETVLTEAIDNAVAQALRDPAKAGSRVEVTILPWSDGRLEFAVNGNKINRLSS